MMQQPTEAELAQYAVVSSRRLQWDNLVWQVPVLSLTAQAFLISIALGSGSSAVARVASSLLSLVLTALSIMLMARHRQAEITDARWMETFEDHYTDGAFVGHAWRAKRDLVDPRTPSTRWVPYQRAAFPVWVWGLSLFGAADVLTIVLTFVCPDSLTGA